MSSTPLDDEIIRPIKKPPQLRSDHDVSLIQEGTKSIPFFAKYIADNKADLHAKCCRFMTYERFEQQSFVFEQGDRGSKFYIMLQGMVGIFIKNKSELKKVKELNSGESFGELALLNDQPRSASIKCLKECHFAVLDKKNYMALFQQIQDNEIKKAVAFYPKIELFSNWNFNKIKQFYNSSFRITLKKGDRVIAESDPVDAIYIIVAGEFIVKKKSYRGDNARRSDLMQLKRQSLSLQTQMNPLFILTGYEIFGQEEAENEDPRFVYSVFCDSFEGSLIYIKIQDYLRIICKDESQQSYMHSYSQKRLDRVANRVSDISFVRSSSILVEPQFPFQQPTTDSSNVSTVNPTNLPAMMTASTSTLFQATSTTALPAPGATSSQAPPTSQLHSQQSLSYIDSPVKRPRPPTISTIGIEGQQNNSISNILESPSMSPFSSGTSPLFLRQQSLINCNNNSISNNNQLNLKVKPVPMLQHLYRSRLSCDLDTINEFNVASMISSQLSTAKNPTVIDSNIERVLPKESSSPTLNRAYSVMAIDSQTPSLSSGNNGMMMTTSAIKLQQKLLRLSSEKGSALVPPLIAGNSQFTQNEDSNPSSPVKTPHLPFSYTPVSMRKSKDHFQFSINDSSERGLLRLQPLAQSSSQSNSFTQSMIQAGMTMTKPTLLASIKSTEFIDTSNIDSSSKIKDEQRIKESVSNSGIVQEQIPTKPSSNSQISLVQGIHDQLRAETRANTIKSEFATDNIMSQQLIGNSIGSRSTNASRRSLWTTNKSGGNIGSNSNISGNMSIQQQQYQQQSLSSSKKQIDFSSCPVNPFETSGSAYDQRKKKEDHQKDLREFESKLKRIISGATPLHPPPNGSSSVATDFISGEFSALTNQNQKGKTNNNNNSNGNYISLGMSDFSAAAAAARISNRVAAVASLEYDDDDYENDGTTNCYDGFNFKSSTTIHNGTTATAVSPANGQFTTSMAKFLSMESPNKKEDLAKMKKQKKLQALVASTCGSTASLSGVGGFNEVTSSYSQEFVDDSKNFAFKTERGASEKFKLKCVSPTATATSVGSPKETQAEYTATITSAVAVAGITTTTTTITAPITSSTPSTSPNKFHRKLQLSLGLNSTGSSSTTSFGTAVVGGSISASSSSLTMMMNNNPTQYYSSESDHKTFVTQKPLQMRDSQRKSMRISSSFVAGNTALTTKASTPSDLLSLNNNDQQLQQHHVKSAKQQQQQQSPLLQLQSSDRRFLQSNSSEKRGGFAIFSSTSTTGISRNAATGAAGVTTHHSIGSSSNCIVVPVQVSAIGMQLSNSPIKRLKGSVNVKKHTAEKKESEKWRGGGAGNSGVEFSREEVEKILTSNRNVLSNALIMSNNVGFRGHKRYHSSQFNSSIEKMAEMLHPPFI